MKMTGGKLIAGLLGVTVFISSCSKNPLNHLTTQETQIYITDHDSTANFSSYKTYSISDSVAVINNDQSYMDLTASDSAYIVAVKKYMQQDGYVLVNKNQNPDIGVDVNRIYNTTGVISYNDYYGYYGSFWDPYWGYDGYGFGVPYAYEVYQITEGAMSVDMLDLKNAAANKKINLLWTGLIRGEGIFDANTADANIQALFTQSPYLKINN